MVVHTIALLIVRRVLSVLGYGPTPDADAVEIAERWVRTVRSECLDWTLIWRQRQLRRVLTEYLRHYNTVRPHRSLDLRPPRPAFGLALVEPCTGESSPMTSGPEVAIEVVVPMTVHSSRSAAALPGSQIKAQIGRVPPMRISRPI